MRERREERSQVVVPNLRDFKIIDYRYDKNNVVSLPRDPVTAEDLMQVAIDSTVYVYENSDHFKDESWKDRLTSLLTIEGITAGSKTTYGDLVFRMLANTLASFSQVMPIIVEDYEEHRAQMFARGKLEGLNSIDQPHENNHIETIISSHEPSFAISIEEGGLVVGMKPAGSYGAVWSRTFNINRFLVSKRPFGTETLKKLRRREVPFNNLEPSRVIWSIDAAIIPSAFVNQVLGRYRNVLQIAESRGDLAMAQNAQKIFKRKQSSSLDELKELREGGSIKGIMRSNQAMKEVVRVFFERGVLHGRLNKNSLIIIDQDIRMESNKSIIESATRSTLIEAEKVASFLSRKPSEALIADFVCFDAYTRALGIVHQSTDLEMGDFYRSHDIESMVSVVYKSEPDINIFSEKDKQNIIRLFEDNDLI